MNFNSTDDLPLSGIRALELSEIWAGPYCGCLLSDMGAEVIKIESIQRIARGPINPSPDGMYPEQDPGNHPWNRQANFNSTNRNKKGLTLDLKTRLGVEAFSDLVKVSDIVFCNYARTVMEGFGLGYEQVKSIKPDIIYLLMPGYGNTGPYKNYRSMGMAIDAITGHSYLRGYPDMDHTSNSLVHHPDAAAAVNATLALSTALVHRELTGEGQFIDMSQAESFMTHMGEMFIEYQMSGVPRDRRGNRHPGYAPQGAYKCEGEDNWIAISITNEEQWNLFCEIISLNLNKDPRFSTVEGRIKNHDDLDSVITTWTSVRERYDVMNALQAKGIPSGVVLNCGPDTYADPHLNEREFFQIVEHPEAGIFPMSGPVLRFDSSYGSVTHNPSPTLGQHNNYILEDILGYSKSKIKLMEHMEIIGTVPLPGADLGGSRRAAKEQARQKNPTLNNAENE